MEGLWTPVLVPRIGYCETSCVLCSQVCPTGAIWEITPKEKGWSVDLAQRKAGSPRNSFLRSRPMPALGHGDGLHRVRGMVSHIAQGNLLSTG